MSEKKRRKLLAYRMISDFYRDKNMDDSSFIYLRMATVINDSINIKEKEKLQEFQNHWIK
ncbi:MAG: hypothetical protein WKF59_19930 [Chitinophagaceae bacterium]